MIYLIWQKSLLTVGKWASTMIDPMKQAQEVKVLRRTQKQNHPLWYSKTVLKQVTSQKNFPKLLGTNWNSKIFEDINCIEQLEMYYQYHHHLLPANCLENRILIFETLSMIKHLIKHFISGLKGLHVIQHWL